MDWRRLGVALRVPSREEVGGDRVGELESAGREVVAPFRQGEQALAGEPLSDGEARILGGGNAG